MREGNEEVEFGVRVLGGGSGRSCTEGRGARSGSMGGGESRGGENGRGDGGRTAGGGLREGEGRRGGGWWRAECRVGGLAGRTVEVVERHRVGEGRAGSGRKRRDGEAESAHYRRDGERGESLGRCVDGDAVEKVVRARTGVAAVVSSKVVWRDRRNRLLVANLADVLLQRSNLRRFRPLRGEKMTKTEVNAVYQEGGEDKSTYNALPAPSEAAVTISVVSRAIRGIGTALVALSAAQEGHDKNRN